MVKDNKISLTDIKVDKSCGSGLDEEAIRVVKISRRWNPGVESAKPVRTRFVFPVKFKLD